MNLKKFALALAASTVLAGAADAAVITKTYQVTSAFTTGPYSSVVTTFDATYDPTATATPKEGAAVTLSNVSITSGVSFGKENAAFFYSPASGFSPERRSLIIGGQGNAVWNSGDGSDDFRINILVSSSGEALRVVDTSYLLSGVTYFGTGSLTDPSITAAVPEPATWAMMLVGFGMIGAASRYRRRSTITTFA